jgi:hypothetical protein
VLFAVPVSGMAADVRTWTWLASHRDGRPAGQQATLDALFTSLKTTFNNASPEAPTSGN